MFTTKSKKKPYKFVSKRPPNLSPKRALIDNLFFHSIKSKYSYQCFSLYANRNFVLIIDNFVIAGMEGNVVFVRDICRSGRPPAAREMTVDSSIISVNMSSLGSLICAFQSLVFRVGRKHHSGHRVLVLADERRHQ